MPPAARQPDNGEAQDDVWGAIATFEQVLEAMPTDKTSLEILCRAYEQVGDLTKAREYLARLGEVTVEEGDKRSQTRLLARLEEHADEPRIRAVIGRIKGTAAPGSGAKEAAAPAADAARAEALGRPFDLNEELSLVWSLLENETINQEEYAAIVQDLTEMSASGANVTVSTFHVLNDRAHKNLEGIMNAVSKSAGTPIIAPAHFDLRRDVISLLPLGFVVHRGALAFERIGRDLLVAVMNPCDRQLRADMELLTGRRCHYFMVHPAEFDAAITRITEMMVQKEDSP